MIFITAKFRVRPEHADRWPDISKEFTDATRVAARAISLTARQENAEQAPVGNRPCVADRETLTSWSPAELAARAVRLDQALSLVEAERRRSHAAAVRELADRQVVLHLTSTLLEVLAFEAPPSTP